MKQSKDPFEAAYEEQDESPADSPIGGDVVVFDTETPISGSGSGSGAGHNSVTVTELEEDDDIATTTINSSHHPSTSSSIVPTATSTANKNKDYDYDYDDENVDVELSKFPASADPVKTAKMQAILSQFTEGQMSRYESFRRSALQRSNMRRLLVSITGSQKISLPMTIVVCGIAKMFVGELVETARIVMTERKESGPIRPCHVREAYRRLKLEGKVPKRSVSRLFR